MEGFKTPAPRTEMPRCRLLRSGFLAQTAHALLQLLPQRGGRIRIECDEVPQWLCAIPAETRQRSRVAVGMPRDVFADRRIRMMRKMCQRFRRNLGMFADQPQQIVIFFWRL